MNSNPKAMFNDIKISKIHFFPIYLLDFKL